MKKQNFDIYYILIGTAYLAISWMMYSKWGPMSLFFIFIAIVFFILYLKEIKSIKKKNDIPML